jgi:hypothetical protein
MSSEANRVLIAFTFKRAVVGTVACQWVQEDDLDWCVECDDGWFLNREDGLCYSSCSQLGNFFADSYNNLCRPICPIGAVPNADWDGTNAPCNPCK